MNWRRWIVLGILGGLMILTRMESFVLLFLPIIEVIYEHRRKITHIFSWPTISRVMAFGAVAIVIFAPQLWVWKRVFGRIFLNPYTEMGHLVDLEKMRRYGQAVIESGSHSSGLSSFLNFFSHPDLQATLVGSSYGIFVWTPILFFATIGLIFLLKKNPFVGLVGVAGVFFLVYVTSCSHKGGMSFGDRYLIKAAPFFVLGLAALLEVAASRIGFKLIVAAILLLIVWNGLFIVQYATGLVNRSGPIDWGKMMENQVTIAPRYFADHMGPFLTGRSNAYKGRKAQSDKENQ